MSSSPVVACDKKSKITKQVNARQRLFFIMQHVEKRYYMYISFQQGKESKNRVLDPKFDSTFKKLLGSDDNKNITQQFIRDITGLSVVDVNFLNPYVEVDTVFQAKSIVL